MPSLLTRASKDHKCAPDQGFQLLTTSRLVVDYGARWIILDHMVDHCAPVGGSFRSTEGFTLVAQHDLGRLIKGNTRMRKSKKHAKSEMPIAPH